MRAGVDLGGTKLEAIAMDADGGVRARVRRASGRTYEESLAAVRDVVAEVERLAAAAISSVGVGIPGSPSPVTGLIRNANSTWLNGRPFGEDLARVRCRRRSMGPARARVRCAASSWGQDAAAGS